MNPGCSASAGRSYSKTSVMSNKRSSIRPEYVLYQTSTISPNLTRNQVSELYDTIKYCALHHRTFLFAIFAEHDSSETTFRHTPQDRRLHELYGRAKALFDLVAPQEYGIDPAEKSVSFSNLLLCVIHSKQFILERKLESLHLYHYFVKSLKISKKRVILGRVL